MKKHLSKTLGVGALSVLLAVLTSCSAANITKKFDASESIAVDLVDQDNFESYGSRFDSSSDSNGSSGFYFDSADYDIEEAFPTESETQSGESNLSFDGRKIIYSSWYTINTTEFDESVQKLNDLCTRYGAYFESASVYGDASYSRRTADYTIRIPNENYNAFIQSTGNLGTVASSGENNRDVTEQYIDTQARLESAELRESRLLEILAAADNLDDILLLERELSDVRYEIESYAGELKKLDSLVSYSTAEIHLNEVVRDIPVDSQKQTLGTRLSLAVCRGFDSFRDTLSDLAVDAAYSLPVFLFIWLPILIVIILLIVIFKKRARKRRVAKAACMNGQIPQNSHEIVNNTENSANNF